MYVCVYVSMYFLLSLVSYMDTILTHRRPCVNSFGRKFMMVRNFLSPPGVQSVSLLPGDDIFLSLNSGFKINSDSAGMARARNRP